MIIILKSAVDDLLTALNDP